MAAMDFKMALIRCPVFRSLVEKIKARNWWKASSHSSFAVLNAVKNNTKAAAPRVTVSYTHLEMVFTVNLAMLLFSTTTTESS